jgi:tellurite methyltransferase
MPDRSGYDEVYRREDYYWGVRPSAMCDRVIALLPPGRPVRLIDLGCGEGRNAVYFARQGYEVVGMDLSQPGLDKTRRLAAETGVQVVTVHADIVHYALDATYDVVFSTGALHYMPAEVREARYADYKAHTAPGGLNTLSVFVQKPFIPPAPDGEPSVAHRYRSGELFGYFWDWEILWCTEEIFDCASGGIPHQHCINRLIARKPTDTHARG